ncbi:MAG: cysteine desulfurase [Candidatus Chaera renei]|uniref:Cysteine desulfurase n=1 Tax=Candidatus Chaera renei TaxID=2506947 RepID=A0A4Q0AG89_9BACT|nr:MAG: cysteine desulfurase [Candidatus Chaera renei]
MTKSKSVYLDYAAATPLDERVFAVMRPYLTERFYNPAAIYQAAAMSRAAWNGALARLAAVIGAKESQLILTAGATESINLAIWGVASRIPTAKVAVLATDHQAALRAAARHPHTIIPVGPGGVASADTVAARLDDDTALVSVDLINSELGTIQPVRQIAAAVGAVRKDRLARGVSLPLWLHCDASQAAGLHDLHLSRLGVDLLSLNAGKCYGPKSTGLLWRRDGVELAPLIVGGGQQFGLRSGTQDVARAVGFAKALELAEEARPAETRRLAALRDRLQRRITDSLKGAIVNGDQKNRCASFLHMSFIGADGERLVYALDGSGVMAATGAACSANRGNRSHVLEAIGLAAEAADGSLRFSLGRQNDQASIDFAADQVIKAVNRELGL